MVIQFLVFYIFLCIISSKLLINALTFCHNKNIFKRRRSLMLNNEIMGFFLDFALRRTFSTRRAQEQGDGADGNGTHTLKIQKRLISRDRAGLIVLSTVGFKKLLAEERKTMKPTYTQTHRISTGVHCCYRSQNTHRTWLSKAQWLLRKLCQDGGWLKANSGA